MSAPTLPEIREADARGSVAETYADIRRVLAVEMVVLYYRVLAARPGRVERVWGLLAPNLRTHGGRDAADRLLPRGLEPGCPLDHDVLRAAGLEPSSLRATVSAFDRANRLNLVALSALLHGAPGDPTADGGPASPLEPIPALPPADLETLAPDPRSLLMRISAPVAGDERPVLVPTLFRVFARDGAVLEALWQSVGAPVESDAFGPAVDDLVDQARRATRQLPLPVPVETDGETRAITERFARTIPGMIVVCDLLRAALADA